MLRFFMMLVECVYTIERSKKSIPSPDSLDAESISFGLLFLSVISKIFKIKPFLPYLTAELLLIMYVSKSYKKMLISDFQSMA